MTAKVRLAHIALAAQNPNALAVFYHDLLGLDVTLEGALPLMGEFVFLSDCPAEQAQTLTFMTQARAKHIAWEVDSQAALKAIYADARARGIAIDRALDHRVTWSLYLRDPEGNGVEVFWSTGQPAGEPSAEPLDLSRLE